MSIGLQIFRHNTFCCSFKESWIEWIVQLTIHMTLRGVWFFHYWWFSHMLHQYMLHQYFNTTNFRKIVSQFRNHRKYIHTYIFVCVCFHDETKFIEVYLRFPTTTRTVYCIVETASIRSTNGYKHVIAQACNLVRNDPHHRFAESGVRLITTDYTMNYIPSDWITTVSNSFAVQIPPFTANKIYLIC